MLSWDLVFLHCSLARIDNIDVAPLVKSHFAPFTGEALQYWGKAGKVRAQFHWNGMGRDCKNQSYLFSKAPYEVSTCRTEYRFSKSLSGNWLMWQKVFFSPLVQTCVRWPERTFLQLHAFSQKSSDLPPRVKSEEPRFHSASTAASLFLPCDVNCFSS